MEESTALWLLGLAHAECEALQNEIDNVRETCRERYESELALRRERDALRAERDAARAEAETLRAELADANARLAEQPTGWRQYGAHWIHTDGRLIESHDDDCYIGFRADGSYGHSGCSSGEAAQEADMCGWSDFPGLTDHSAADP